jgi:hypothetical protein
LVLGVALTLAVEHGPGPRPWRDDGTPTPSPTTVAPATTVPPKSCKPSKPSKPGLRQVIVRVASLTDCAHAQRVEARLKQLFPGQPVCLLRSTEYDGLRPHYWVPCMGPWPDTPKGNAAARELQAKIRKTSIRTSFIDPVRRRERTS